MMSRRLLSTSLIVAVILVLTAVLYPLSASRALAQQNCRTFTETSKTVCGRFLEYWNTHGGLAQQGYPISGEFTEVSDLNGQPYTVQYFERAVFEKHPENAIPNDVLLSQLGTFQFKRKYPNGEPAGSGQPVPPVATPTQPPSAPPPTAVPPSVGEIQVSGHGTQVSQPVELKQGLAVFHSVHTNGSSNFIVHLVDMSGKDVAFLANEIGSADISTADRIPSNGQYMFQVRADGDWTITTTQPKGTYAPPPATQQWSGHGSQVTNLFSLRSGAARFQLTHTNGESNFIVHLIDADGNTKAFLANEIGPANISTIENIPANGVFLLEVEADGDWTVVVQQSGAFDRLAQGNCRTFAETGKTACGRFLDYWQTHGGLAQQGFPLSGEFTEISDLNGQPYTVQYFERAVFEYHPENPAPNDVLLSQLGTFQFKRKYPGGEPQGTTAPGSQPPPPTQAPVPSSSAPKDAEGYAKYLASKFTRVGSYALQFEDTSGSDILGSHVLTLYMDSTSFLGFRKNVSKSDAQAWGDAVIADAKANWPGGEFIIELSYGTYSTNICTGNCNDDCYYQGDNYLSGQGWFTVFTFVYISDSRGVHVCDMYFDK